MLNSDENYLSSGRVTLGNRPPKPETGLNPNRSSQDRAPPPAMNSSALVLLGAFDVLIVFIQTQRQIFDNCVNTEATIQTLHRIKNEYAEQLLAFTRAQAHASEAFRSTLDQLLAALPQGSDLEPVLRSLQLTLFAFMGSGPTP